MAACAGCAADMTAPVTRRPSTPNRTGVADELISLGTGERYSVLGRPTARVTQVASHDHRPPPADSSPAAGAPLGQRPALGAQGRVVAVPRVEPGVVGQPVEDLVLDVVDQGR